MMCTSTQSRSHLSSTQMSIFVFHLYPGNVKPWSMSRGLHLTSQDVPSHLHPGRRIRVSAPSRCHLTPIQVWKFASKLHLCSVPPPSTFRSHLISIQAQIFASHIHPGDVYRSCATMCTTHPYRSCLTCIQIPISLSHLRPCTVSLPSRSEVSCLICIHVTSHLQPTHFHSSHAICITAPSMSYLTPIRVSILVPELHPDHVSPPSKSHDLCLISIQVTPQTIPLHLSSSQGPSQPHPGLQMCVSPPSMSRLTSIQFPTVASPSIPIVSHFHPGHAIFISPPSRPGLISIQVARLAAELHPCSISPHPGLKICILPPSISCLTPSRSLDSHLTFF